MTARSQQLSVETDVSPARAMVVLAGELDIVITPELSACLAPILSQQPRRLVFDMACVTFLDCAAARVILSTGRLLPAGHFPVLRGPSPAVLRLLELAGLGAYCAVEG